MSRSARLSESEILSVMRHLADVAALKGDPPAQRQLLIDGLNELVGTHSAFFYVADDYVSSKRPHFSHATLTTQQDPTLLRYISEWGIRFPLEDDPYCYHSRTCGDPMQLWTRRNVDPDRTVWWRHPNFLDLCSTGRLRDGLVSFYRTGPGNERIVGVGMHRFGDAKALSARQTRLARFAVAEIRRLVERGHLALPPGDMSDALPPRLGQIFDRLLNGRTPKSIARELDLSVWTVREHVQRLYKHFNVSGREELMARFVGGFEQRPLNVHVGGIGSGT